MTSTSADAGTTSHAPVRERPPLDPELDAALLALADEVPASIRPDTIEATRARPKLNVTTEMLEQAGIVSRDIVIPAPDGHEILASVLQARDRRGPGPGIYHLHGGGMIIGDRWSGIANVFPWLLRYDAVAVTIEYRLAPEHPDPQPIEDAYAGLEWMAAHESALGTDGRILLVGGSAGGGLAAGASLLARDRGGPSLVGQMLMYPMLDDRDSSVSSQQMEGVGGWDRGSNLTAWSALLGDRRGTDDVSIYAAPARATDLSRLPPTFIDCGSAEVFRDEDVAFASAIWAAGGRAELHVWPGGFHAFEGYAPQAALSQAMVATRDRWVHRMLGH